MTHNRNIYLEIMEGLDALKAEHEGKVTLKKVTLAPRKHVSVDAKMVRSVREKLNVSTPVFAHALGINVRTVENWEQGRAKPNQQAATLIRLVEKHPETLKLLEAL